MDKQEASILKELAKMELNPVAYLEVKMDLRKITPVGKIERKLVISWAYLLLFNPEMAKNLCENILKQDDITEHAQLKANALLIKASALSMMMKLPEMKVCLDAAKECTQKSGVLYTNIALNLSYASYHAGIQENHKAEQFALSAIGVVDEVKEPYLKADLLWRLATVYRVLRRYDVAVYYLVDCLRICLGNGYKLRVLLVSTELVSLYSHLGLFNKAEKLYQQGIELQEELDLPVYLVNLNYSYGLMHKLQKKLPEAIHYYEASLNLIQAQTINIPQMLYSINNNLANALSEIGELERALIHHEQAEKLATKMKNVTLQMQSSNNIALAYIALKRYDEVLPRLKKAISYYRKTKNLEYLIKALRTEGFYYQEIKDYKNGFRTMGKLDDVQMKFVAQLRADFALHSRKLIDAHLEDTRILKTKIELAERKLDKSVPNTFIGSSTASREVVENALLASLYPDSCVFIEGESGTGKEIVAKMIHSNSSRSNKPYVTVNCASISPSLFESEFFGHVRGSFTGANQDKQGFFQLAKNGTLFLDEISEIPMDFQAKLLRAIDTKTIMPVGKGSEEKINCKIITATNHNIHKLIIDNKFRLDLFHRISTIEIRIPALRDRVDDIPVLLNYFLERYAVELKKPKPKIYKDFMERFCAHTFPGNVRELKNYVERIYVMYYKPIWDAKILDNISTFNQATSFADPVSVQELKSIEAKIIQDVLNQCGGKQKEAAKRLKLTESTLSRKLRRLGIKD